MEDHVNAKIEILTFCVCGLKDVSELASWCGSVIECNL